jgi:hypothetical protein
MKRVLLLAVGLTCLTACGGRFPATASPTIGPAAPTVTPIKAVYDSQAGLQRCLNWQAKASAFQLEAAYDTNAGTIAAWLNKWVGSPSTFAIQNGDANLVASVCYFRGAWAVPAPRGINEVWDRAIIFAYGDGSVVQGPFGNAEGVQPNPLPLNRPSS